MIKQSHGRHPGVQLNAAAIKAGQDENVFAETPDFIRVR